MTASFSDDPILRAILDFEVTLAKVESRLGIIPVDAAEAIAAAANTLEFDMAELARGSLRAGTPSIPLVKVLREKVRSVCRGRKKAIRKFTAHEGVQIMGMIGAAMLGMLRLWRFGFFHLN